MNLARSSCYRKCSIAIRYDADSPRTVSADGPKGGKLIAAHADIVALPQL
jgi:hypothetical protein